VDEHVKPPESRLGFVDAALGLTGFLVVGRDRKRVAPGRA
jgi:hypothetical protein